ncbi:recombinase family protein [Candidatus Microgenomates bacterium]|nr:MAG: recombinase family protein [Candidatus Microgenomates bacterium]
MEIGQPIQYCLYARKSSESDERQAMSIESQVNEMSQLARKEGLFIKNIYRESHSAKTSGTRPLLMQLISDIRNGEYNGILTWAPDRLSRNAGDLGMLVDLMDQEKLVQIKTFSQMFSNNPNEKFLLMILCSQAKLENDQKGINVKRGIRAKCDQGWRPGVAPLGYYNRAFAGTKDIVVDPERGPLVKEMFEKAAYNKDSGRKIKLWLAEKGFTNRTGTTVSLSQVYLMLKNPFYYGEFEYPVGSGTWYTGKHKPLITKTLFNKVQEKLKVPEKSKWGAKSFTYKGIFKCANCKASVVAEERYRKRKYGRQPRHHIYYHCSRQKDYKCKEPYVTEKKLEESIYRFINFVYINHPKNIKLTKSLREDMGKYKEVRDQILLQQNIDPDSQIWDVRDYAKHILSSGDSKKKRELLNMFDYQFYLQNARVTTLRAH